MIINQFHCICLNVPRITILSAFLGSVAAAVSVGGSWQWKWKCIHINRMHNSVALFECIFTGCMWYCCFIIILCSSQLGSKNIEPGPLWPCGFDVCTSDDNHNTNNAACSHNFMAYYFISTPTWIYSWLNTLVESMNRFACKFWCHFFAFSYFSLWRYYWYNIISLKLI